MNNLSEFLDIAAYCCEILGFVFTIKSMRNPLIRKYIEIAQKIKEDTLFGDKNELEPGDNEFDPLKNVLQETGYLNKNDKIKWFHTGTKKHAFNIKYLTIYAEKENIDVGYDILYHNIRRHCKNIHDSRGILMFISGIALHWIKFSMNSSCPRLHYFYIISMYVISYVAYYKL